MPATAGSWKKQESSRKTSISALLTIPKPLTVWITVNCGKFCELAIFSAAAAKSLVSDSGLPHRPQPTRFPRPWDSPDKNTGVGCHFLLQCVKVKSESEVTQLCLTLSDPTDCSLRGSSIHGIFQARVWSGVPLDTL